MSLITIVWFSVKRSMIPGSISLGGTMSLLGALNLRLSEASPFLRKLPKKPVSGDHCSQKEFSPPLIFASIAGLTSSFDLIRWSMHWATLQLSGRGFQLSCSSEREPNAIRKSLVICSISVVIVVVSFFKSASFLEYLLPGKSFRFRHPFRLSNMPRPMHREYRVAIIEAICHKSH